ncbi:MAG: glycosyltransferase family 2 protein [Candidatus Eisenbacteria bacterium]
MGAGASAPLNVPGGMPSAPAPSRAPASDSLPLPGGPATDPHAITAVVLALNEEANIERCLRSLLWADRILLVDNGSTDRTVEIAAGFTSWIVPHVLPPEIDPVHGNLNWAFPQIPAGWILQVDADERVSPELAAEMRAAVASQPSDAAFAIPFWTSVLGTWPSYGYWGRHRRLIRLFRSGRGRYRLHAIHEPLEVDGTVGRLAAPILHEPYPTLRDFIRKTNRYTTREAQRILDGTSPGTSAMGLKAARSRTGLIAIWAGVRLFLWSYLRLSGWREGRIGIATSSMLGIYGFLEVLKVWEAARGPKTGSGGATAPQAGKAAAGSSRESREG